MPPNEIARRPGRSHPPSLLRLAERLIRDERLIERGDEVRLRSATRWAVAGPSSLS